MATVLLSRQLLTPLERIDDAALVMDDGIITAVDKREALSLPPNARLIDFGDAILTPGLIDIHVHGGGGHDVMESSAESLIAIESLMARHGVTGYCPTTVTAAMDDTLRTLEKLAQLAKAWEAEARSGPARAHSLGIHLEGPFLSQARRGVHSSMHLQRPSVDAFDQMWDAADGRISILTLAPELGGALELVSHASSRGICVSIGHSNATLAQANAGIAAGACHATHAFNAMRRLDHRDPGLLGAILTNDAITADIIVDGIHVEPAVVDLFMRAKGVDGAVLITDGTSATGMPDGTYRLGSYEVQVRDGRCESHGKLAGSVLTLDLAIQNTMKFANISFQEAVRLATFNPARVLGIERRKGSLHVGADADIAVFSNSGEVQRAIVGGFVDI